MPDQLPPEDAAAPYVPFAVITRMSERVAAIEARVAVEIANLKEDTKVIRSAIHEINNNSQQTLAAEVQCASALKSLDERQKEHVAELQTIKGLVETLQADRTRLDGAWWALGKLAVIGSFLAAAFWWAWQHLTIRP